MRSFFPFIKSKQFFIQLSIILVLIVLIIFLTLRWLASYTNHGEYVMVPSFKGKNILDLDEFIADKEVTYEIIDSIYDPKEKPGIVLRQDPEMNSKVKHNRTVYLYVTGLVPPQIIMPKLVDRSERQAKLIISSYGLRLGNVVEKSADCNGCVIEQLMNSKFVEAGTSVPKGSVIDIVVGRKDAYYLSESDSTQAIEPE